MPFVSVPEAVEEIRSGRILVVVDDEDRENEGDLTIAAEKITPEAINFMARWGRGLICMPMTEERLAELEIPQMVAKNTARFDTAFTVSIEAKGVTSTGISANDRAATASSIGANGDRTRVVLVTSSIPRASLRARATRTCQSCRTRGSPGR